MTTLEKLRKIIIKEIPEIDGWTKEQSKLQDLSNYFYEAGHKEALRATNKACEELGNKIGRPIRLSDILNCSGKKNVGNHLAINEQSSFWFFNGHSLEPTKYKWNLEKDNLNDQSQETIDFLYYIFK